MHIKVYSTVANDLSDLVGERGGHCLERVKGTKKEQGSEHKVHGDTPYSVGHVENRMQHAPCGCGEQILRPVNLI